MAVFDKGSKIPAALFASDAGPHTVRLIKADQAGAFLSPDQKNHDHAKNTPRKPAEVRLVATGADYCDLELVCGCGEVTRFRAWSTPGAAEAKAA
jgi:hypothetical protein